MSSNNADALRALAPLRTSDYRLLFAAVGIEVFGTGMWTIVMVFQVLALDDSPPGSVCRGDGTQPGTVRVLDIRWRGR